MCSELYSAGVPIRVVRGVAQCLLKRALRVQQLVADHPPQQDPQFSYEERRNSAEN